MFTIYIHTAYTHRLKICKPEANSDGALLKCAFRQDTLVGAAAQLKGEQRFPKLFLLLNNAAAEAADAQLKLTMRSAAVHTASDFALLTLSLLCEWGVCWGVAKSPPPSHPQPKTN